MSNTMNRLVEVLRDFFDDEELVVTEKTVASDVEGWDSLEHITLLHVIEDEFGVSFDVTKHMANVGELAAEIERQLHGKA